MTNYKLRQKRFLKLFREEKCLTLEALGQSLDCSIRSIQRLLKKTGYFSSFTHNSKWYALRSTPSFGDTGLWFHEDIGFSRHGNLTRTIYYFVNKSQRGLAAREISEIISTPCHSVLNIMYKKNQIDRVSARNGFIYISLEKGVRERQLHLISQSSKCPLPSDADAVTILVELIKNPTFGPDELASHLGDRINCGSESITRLLQRHELEKKTRRQKKSS